MKKSCCTRSLSGGAKIGVPLLGRPASAKLKGPQPVRPPKKGVIRPPKRPIF